MTNALIELQRKQQKLEQVVSSIVALKKQEQQLRKKRQSRRLLVAAIKGTFFAVSWFSKHGDELFSNNDHSSFSSDQSDDFIDDSLIDELFNDFFETFADLDFSNVSAIVASIDLDDITLPELEATQFELQNLLVESC